MSVFTPISPDLLDEWLKGYCVGRLIQVQGIAAGVQNSNFFVTTSLGRYVLTVFEVLPAKEVAFYLDLMTHLARSGMPVPLPVTDRQGRVYGILEAKPAALVSCMSGASVDTPSAAQCSAVGDMLAGLHQAGQIFAQTCANPRGAAWRKETAARLRALMRPAEQELLDKELEFQRHADFSSLPRGMIHADLFRDNVLMNDERITGVLDFYLAGCDAWIYDIAIAVNDWCRDSTGHLDGLRAGDLLCAYANARPFTDIEKQWWPTVLRAAALRFWLSRSDAALHPRSGEMVMIKDPDYYRNILMRLQAGEGIALP